MDISNEYVTLASIFICLLNGLSCFWLLVHHLLYPIHKNVNFALTSITFEISADSILCLIQVVDTTLLKILL